jgi:FkbM family methyltransferase
MSGKLKALVFHHMQRLARKRGMDLQPRRDPPAELGHFLERHDVDVVLDVGAATGDYGRRIRTGGYQGRIWSFEPLKHAYKRLERVSAEDPGWSCERLALASEEGTAEINVAANSDSSSLLKMGERHARSYPESVYIGTENIELRTLDSLWDRLVKPGERAFLKLDVQGFEMEALRGAERSLPKVDGVQAELSLVPLYEGAPEWTEVISYLQERGFHVAALQPAFDDPKTGEVLQVDGIFTRDTRVPD